MVLLVSVDEVMADAKPNVYWSGFAFMGKKSDVRVQYAYTSKLNENTDDGTPYLSRIFREYFQGNIAKLNRINLKFGAADQELDTLALSLVMMDEKVLRESFGDIHKLVVQLGFELVVLDFEGLNVVCSQPIVVEFRDVSDSAFTDEQIQERIRLMIAGPDSQLQSVLNEKVGKVQVLGRNQCTLQIKKIIVGDKVEPFLPEHLKSQPEVLNQFAAQQFGVLLSSKAEVATLPFAKDAANANMALVFSDGSAVQFKIPEPTFAVDLNLRGFKKVLSKKTAAESLWVYGAFLDVKVYEPEFQITFFEKPLKYGVSKIVPASQSKVDEFPVVSEAFKGVCLEAIDQIQKDKNTSKKVISKCKY